MRILLRSFALLCLAPLAAAWAQVLSVQGQEVEISFQASFLTENKKSEAEDEAAFHASHLFGLLQSPEWTRKNGLNPHHVAGLGAPRWPMNIVVTQVDQIDSKTREITYQAKGIFLLQKDVAARWLKEGSLEVPLPYALEQIYDPLCTDEHYDTWGDYWYFYNVYRRGCTYLQEEPYAHPVKLKIRPRRIPSPEISARLDKLRGDNENGDLFSIYVIHGFDEDSRDRDDEGRQAFEEFNASLSDRGFNQKIYRGNGTRPLYVSEKELASRDGRRHARVVIKSLLVDTSSESRGKTFAKFFKEAIEEGDVVLYAGHSGLGGNLDLDLLEEKAGTFHFNVHKKQLFFFDSCSSYSYYLEPFKNSKTRKSADILTYGLPSYFATGFAVHKVFLDILLDLDANPDWVDFLHALEHPLRGESYLLNVGSL